MARRGLVLTAPSSGAGKTVVTLSILRALAARGVAVAGAKSGPDYIDPRFHEAACGQPSINLDAWAMTPETLCARAAKIPAEYLIVEGAMGVLDGAGIKGAGSVADLTETLALPAILIVDIAKTAQSAALAPAGLRSVRPDLPVAGVILNRVASDRHAEMARRGLDALDIPVLGAVPRDPALDLPERHLGLVQAGEHPDLTAFLDRAAEIIGRTVDLDRLIASAFPLRPAEDIKRMPTPGQRIAVARDQAFAFSYPHMLDDWRARGAEILPFSPLADQPPDAGADAIFLPGGYPELHAGQLATARAFADGMRNAAGRGATIYGECGGYMVLGTALTDASGHVHPMLGLLPLETSFATRRLSLGYRRLDSMGGPFDGPLMAHEFHYATVLHEDGQPLFAATDADGRKVADMGLRKGSVSGSFAHVIGPA